jgi:hypothetical protein
MNAGTYALNPLVGIILFSEVGQHLYGRSPRGRHLRHTSVQCLRLFNLECQSTQTV